MEPCIFQKKISGKSKKRRAFKLVFFYGKNCKMDKIVAIKISFVVLNTLCRVTAFVTNKEIVTEGIEDMGFNILYRVTTFVTYKWQFLSSINHMFQYSISSNYICNRIWLIPLQPNYIKFFVFSIFLQNPQLFRISDFC